TIEGGEYELRDNYFPTIDTKNPYALSEEEQEVVDRIYQSVISSDKLHRDMQCIYSKGSMYKVSNNNLLFHASIPLTEDGEFKSVEFNGKSYKGRAYFDKCEELIRHGYFGDEDSPETQYAKDFMWYMWCGKNSPLFDKNKMATFECYFLNDKEAKVEKKGNYYVLCDNVDICNKILAEFGIVAERSHIINGHVPVKTTRGEKPIKADGKLLVIDGGFSKAYQTETGIAGYTLVYHSHGLQLAQHEPFLSRQEAIEEGADIKSATFIVEYNLERVLVKDTDIGVHLRRQISELEKLLVAYQMGLITEK
ncbi:MAG: fructose-bisphosphatase class III, partial [Rikenellaceae bacterium]